MGVLERRSAFERESATLCQELVEGVAASRLVDDAVAFARGVARMEEFVMFPCFAVFFLHDGEPAQKLPLGQRSLVRLSASFP
jgi:hypothetical protein